jgi:hypothetical protein
LDAGKRLRHLREELRPIDDEPLAVVAIETQRVGEELVRNLRIEDADAGPDRRVPIRRGRPGQPAARREPHPYAAILLNLVAYAVGDRQPRRYPPVVLREPGGLDDRECDCRVAVDDRELRRTVTGRAGQYQAVQVETGNHGRLAVDARDRIAEPISNHVAAEYERAVEVRAIDLCQAHNVDLRADADRVGRTGKRRHVRQPRPVRRVFPEQRILIASGIECLEHEDCRRRDRRPIEQVIAGHSRAQLVSRPSETPRSPRSSLSDRSIPLCTLVRADRNRSAGLPCGELALSVRTRPPPCGSVSPARPF